MWRHNFIYWSPRYLSLRNYQCISYINRYFNLFEIPWAPFCKTKTEKASYSWFLWNCQTSKISMETRQMKSRIKNDFSSRHGKSYLQHHLHRSQSLQRPHIYCQMQYCILYFWPDLKCHLRLCKSEKWDPKRSFYSLTTTTICKCASRSISWKLLLMGGVHSSGLVAFCKYILVYQKWPFVS